MSDPPATEAKRRIAAESLALRRSPLDPLRAAAAAECAGLVVTEEERALLADLLERLTDPALGAAALAGDAEGAARLATLVAADALVRGERRLLWIGPRPRAVDRLCERCELRLVVVRNERGAYDGEGLFAVDDLESAPPGLGQARPFDRVLSHEAPAAPPWRGRTLALGPGDDALLASRVERPAPGLSLRPPDPAARAVDDALAEPLRSLAPALGPLARAAAAGSLANRAATLARLETRLGRMVRAARAGRADDGSETARQLASDHDGLEALLAEALEEQAASEEEDVDALEAERERLAGLRAAVEAATDPLLETIVARSRAALADGRGVAIVLPGRATREALAEALGGALAEGREVEARLEAARDGPSIAILALAEHGDHRLDGASFEGLRVLAHQDAPIPAADELFGEGPATDTEREAPTAAVAPPADAPWARWRRTLGLTHPTAHARSRETIDAALGSDPSPWRIARLVRDEGDALLIVGESRAHEPAFPTFAEATFHAERPLLRVGRVRLERALDAARRERRRAGEDLRERRRVAEQRIEEARRRKARASGAEAREEASDALREAEAALEPLRAEARSIDDAHDQRRRAALDRFAARATRVEREGPTADPSHPRERVHG